MASGLARNVSRSYLARSFSSYAQYLWRPKKQSMFADQQSHSVFNYTETGCKPYFSLVCNLYNFLSLSRQVFVELFIA